MKYEEFKNWDYLDAYNDFMPVYLAKEENIIPKDYKDLIPNNCKCGSEFIVSSNLKELRCCDPYCSEKLANRLANLFSSYGLKDLGYSTCKFIINYLKGTNKLEIPSHIEALKFYNNPELLSYLGAKGDLFKRHCETIMNTRVSFSTLCSRMGIPYLGDSAMQIFAPISSIREIVQIVKNNKFRQYLNDRGVKNLKRILEIEYNLVPILVFESLLKVPLLKVGEYNKTVCITGPVSINGQSYTRDAFLKYCNDLGDVGEKQLFNVRQSKALNSVSIFIADYPSTTDKYTKAVARINRGENCEIITADEFVSRLKEEVEIWKTTTN